MLCFLKTNLLMMVTRLRKLVLLLKFQLELIQLFHLQCMLIRGESYKKVMVSLNVTPPVGALIPLTIIYYNLNTLSLFIPVMLNI